MRFAHISTICLKKWLILKDDEDEWHEKILGFIKELKESGKLTDYNQLAFLFSSVKHQRVTALKIDQIKCETEYKVVENQSIFSETMTKEEVDAEKRKLLYHWIGLLSSLTKLRNAGELDVESTLAQLTEPMMIERVNALLGENPNLLETDKYILLHSLLGRDLYMEGQLIPIRAAEIKKVAKNNGGF